MDTVKVLELVADLLDMEKEIVSENSSDEKTLRLMVVALNNVISEIAEEYIPFIKSEKVVLLGGSIPYTAFSTSPQEIIKVKRGRKSLAFCSFANEIKLSAEDGEVEVVYSYIPEKCSFGDNIALPPELSLRTLAYGVAGEFALMSARYEECVNYDNRFISAVSSAKRRKKERKLPYRGWI